MTARRLRAACAGGALLALGVGVQMPGRAADAARGRALFEECVACHSLGEDADGDALGPSLAGVLNREAAARNDYRYSRALTTSGIVWTLANIEAFIADPQGFVRGNRMAYAGMSDGVDREDLMAYLAEVLTEVPTAP
jgi:cytochrome c